jgi:hypothetical protein
MFENFIDLKYLDLIVFAIIVASEFFFFNRVNSTNPNYLSKSNSKIPNKEISAFISISITSLIFILAYYLMGNFWRENISWIFILFLIFHFLYFWIKNFNKGINDISPYYLPIFYLVLTVFSWLLVNDFEFVASTHQTSNSLKLYFLEFEIVSLFFFYFMFFLTIGPRGQGVLRLVYNVLIFCFFYFILTLFTDVSNVNAWGLILVFLTYVFLKYEFQKQFLSTEVQDAKLKNVYNYVSLFVIMVPLVFMHFYYEKI